MKQHRELTTIHAVNQYAKRLYDRALLLVDISTVVKEEGIDKELYDITEELSRLSKYECLHFSIRAREEYYEGVSK